MAKLKNKLQTKEANFGNITYNKLSKITGYSNEIFNNHFHITSQNQIQKIVERGQDPKEVDRVDKAHTKYGQEHVHFKDGTAINKDGTTHDDGHGIPKLNKKVLYWLNGNGWCLDVSENKMY